MKQKFSYQLKYDTSFSVNNFYLDLGQKYIFLQALFLNKMFFSIFSDVCFCCDNSTHNSKWNFEVVCGSINLSVKVTKSSIYYCEYYYSIN